MKKRKKGKGMMKKMRKKKGKKPVKSVCFRIFAKNSAQPSLPVNEHRDDRVN